MSLVIDTWVWAEYFLGSAVAESIRPVIESGDHATSVVTVAELSDIYHGVGLDTIAARLAYVSSKTRLLQLTPEIARAAGAAKWEQRQRRVPMGLADAMIYETARANGLRVLTGDEGFRGLPDVDFVK